MQPAKPQIRLSIRESLESTMTVKILTEQHLELFKLNPFKPNGVSHCYQLEQSIFVSIDVGWYFSFYSNFNRTFCKQTVETLIRRRVLWRLVWICIVCLCPTKRTLGFYGSKESCADSSESTLSNCHLVGQNRTEQNIYFIDVNCTVSCQIHEYNNKYTKNIYLSIYLSAPILVT